MRNDHNKKAFEPISDLIVPAEGETTVRTYHCTQLSPVFAIFGLKIDGYLTVTNKRVTFFSSGSSLYGIKGKSKHYSEIPITDVANLSVGQGTRFSLLRLIGALFVSVSVASFVGITRPFLFPFLDFDNANAPYLFRFGFFFYAALATCLLLISSRFSRQDGWRVVLSSLGFSLISLVAGYAVFRAPEDSVSQLYPMLTFLLGGVAVCYWLYSLYTFIRREYLSLVIASKSGFAQPIKLLAMSWWSRFNNDAGMAGKMAPAADAGILFRELGSVVTDLKTLGDMGVEKWLKKPLAAPDASIFANDDGNIVHRSSKILASTTIMLLCLVIGVESLHFSHAAKQASVLKAKQAEVAAKQAEVAAALEKRGQVEKARKVAEANNLVGEWVPGRWDAAEEKRNAGNSLFSKGDFSSAIGLWSEAIRRYNDLPADAEAMRKASLTHSQYMNLAMEAYLEESATGRLEDSHLMTEWVALMNRYPTSEKAWSTVTSIVSNATTYTEQEEWMQAKVAWDNAKDSLLPATKEMRANIWVDQAETAIQKGDVKAAFKYAGYALSQNPSHSAAKQLQTLAGYMYNYEKQFIDEINEGRTSAKNMDELIGHLDRLGSADWRDLKRLTAECKILISESKWQECVEKWSEALSKQQNVIREMQTERLETYARRGDWATVSNLADSVLKAYPKHSRASELKNKAYQVLSGLSTEESYQQELSSIIGQEVTNMHLAPGNMSEFFSYMERYGYEDWNRVQDAIRKAKDFANDERGEESSEEWAQAVSLLPVAIQRARAEVWVEKAEQEVVNNNWAKVLIYAQNALSEQADNVRARELMDKADSIEQMNLMRAKYEQLLSEATARMDELGYATNDQEILVATLDSMGVEEWKTVKKQIQEAEELQNQGKRKESTALWAAACAGLPGAIQELHAQYWVNQAIEAMSDNRTSEALRCINKSLQEKPDYTPAKELKSNIEGEKKVISLRGKYDAMLSDAAGRMPDTAAADLRDHTKLPSLFELYGGELGKVVTENLSEAANYEKEERWADCLAAWQSVLENLPKALSKTCSGIWLAQAENAARDQKWDKVAEYSERAITEYPENSVAIALKTQAAEELRAIEEGLKKVHPPPTADQSSSVKTENTDIAGKPTKGASLTPDQERAIRVLIENTGPFVSPDKSTADATTINRLIELAKPFRDERTALDLIASPRSSQSYLASVNIFWQKASAVPGEFGDKIRDAAWQVIDQHLARIAETTIKGKILSLPPEQQARARREFIKVLSRIDVIAEERLSTCSDKKSPRTFVSRYFADGFFSDEILTERVGNDAFLEGQILWIKDLFRLARERRGIKFVE